MSNISQIVIGFKHLLYHHQYPVGADLIEIMQTSGKGIDRDLIGLGKQNIITTYRDFEKKDQENLTKAVHLLRRNTQRNTGKKLL